MLFEHKSSADKFKKPYLKWRYCFSPFTQWCASCTRRSAITPNIRRPKKSLLVSVNDSRLRAEGKVRKRWHEKTISESGFSALGSDRPGSQNSTRCSPTIVSAPPVLIKWHEEDGGDNVRNPRLLSLPHDWGAMDSTYGPDMRVWRIVRFYSRRRKLSTDGSLAKKTRCLYGVQVIRKSSVNDLKEVRFFLAFHLRALHGYAVEQNEGGF